MTSQSFNQLKKGYRMSEITKEFDELSDRYVALMKIHHPSYRKCDAWICHEHTRKQGYCAEHYLQAFDDGGLEKPVKKKRVNGSPLSKDY